MPAGLRAGSSESNTETSQRGEAKRHRKKNRHSSKETDLQRPEFGPEMSCFSVGSQPTSLKRIIDEQKSELESLHREKKDEAAASNNEISSLRQRVIALETQLGQCKSPPANEADKETERGNQASVQKMCTEEPVYRSRGINAVLLIENICMF